MRILVAADMTPEQSLAALEQEWSRTIIAHSDRRDERWRLSELDNNPKSTPADLKERGFPEPTE